MLAFEVWRPGVAGALWRLEEAGVDNVRLISVDAVWSMRHLFAPGSVAELWTFFPDPWPKKRHHKRRLLQPAFVSLIARKLSPGGVVHLATDVPDYADHMAAVFAENLSFAESDAGFVSRSATKFEKRGLKLGHPIRDLFFRRRS